MALNPEEIRNKSFSIVRKGYERGEVHRFLDGIAQEVEQFRSDSGLEGDTPQPDAQDTQSWDLPDPLQSPDAPSNFTPLQDTPMQAVAQAIDPFATSPTMPGHDGINPLPMTDSAPQDAPLFESTQPQADTVDSSSIQSVPAVPTPPVAPEPTGNDFSHLGAEISAVLQQAKTTALQITEKAEQEAALSVSEASAQIERNRQEHNLAADQLITRTEARASELRQETELYVQNAKTAADQDRQVAAERLAATEALRQQAVESARHEAEAESQRVLEEAQRRVAALSETEATMKRNLEMLHGQIAEALGNLEQSRGPLAQPAPDIPNLPPAAGGDPQSVVDEEATQFPLTDPGL